MRNIILAFILPLAGLAQVDTTGSSAPISYEGYIAISNRKGDNFQHLVNCFDRSFAKYSGTSIIRKSAKTDSLVATSRVNFVQHDVLAREQTRGAISFDIRMYADATGVYYQLDHFYHRGNSLDRYGAKNFGLLTNSTEPPMVRGISRKNRMQIWAEMKDTVNVNIQKRLMELEQQLKLNF